MSVFFSFFREDFAYSKASMMQFTHVKAPIQRGLFTCPTPLPNLMCISSTTQALMPFAFSSLIYEYLFKMHAGSYHAEMSDESPYKSFLVLQSRYVNQTPICCSYSSRISFTLKSVLTSTLNSRQACSSHFNYENYIIIVILSPRKAYALMSFI